MKKQAVLSLSGGMDSSTVLLHLLADDYEVTAVSFDYGQKHNVELKRAKELVAYLQVNNLDVDHHVIKLDGLQELLDSNLIKYLLNFFSIEHLCPTKLVTFDFFLFSLA